MLCVFMCVSRNSFFLVCQISVNTDMGMVLIHTHFIVPSLLNVSNCFYSRSATCVTWWRNGKNKKGSSREHARVFSGKSWKSWTTFRAGCRPTISDGRVRVARKISRSTRRCKRSISTTRGSQRFIRDTRKSGDRK